MVSTILYEKRFGPYFIEPIIAGLEPCKNTTSSDTDDSTDEKRYKTFLCGMDLIGAPVYTNDFICAGTTAEELQGCCEAMYRPNLEPEDLFETISQCMLAAANRDCLAGWGSVVYILTPENLTIRQLRTRMD